MHDPDVDLVLETAALARLSLDADEARTLGPQFAAILAQFQVLAELPLDGVEPTTGAAETGAVTRPDEPRPSFDADALLRNAPDRRDDFYGVPKTIGGSE